MLLVVIVLVVTALLFRGSVQLLVTHTGHPGPVPNIHKNELVDFASQIQKSVGGAKCPP